MEAGILVSMDRSEDHRLDQESGSLNHEPLFRLMTLSPAVRLRLLLSRLLTAAMLRLLTAMLRLLTALFPAALTAALRLLNRFQNLCGRADDFPDRFGARSALHRRLHQLL
jgi:hypothetical protein